MGLDVFFYLAKKTRKRENYTSSYDFICNLEEDEDKRVLSILKDKVNTSLKEMRKAKKDWEEKNPDKTFSMDCIINLYRMFYHDMAEFFPYDFERKPIEHPESIKAIEEWAKKEYKYFSKPEAAYFRKVNCIYKYFSDRLEQECCIVEKKDVIDIMGRAIRILETKDTELAERLLPTREGFFFGSTEYDSWYFKDMEEILKEFGKLLNAWEDDDICYVVMSW